MTRPKKNTVDYFPHSCKHGRTMFTLEEAFGNDGYAFWFKLLEILGSTEGHFIDTTIPSQWRFIVAQGHTSTEQATEMLNLLSDLEAIDVELWTDHKVIWCQHFVDGISHVYGNRRTDTPTRPSFYTSKPRAAVVSTEEKPHSRVKDSIVEKSKEYSPIFFDVFWKEYPKKQSKPDAIKAFKTLKVDDTLLGSIMDGLAKWKASDQWAKGVIPHPGSWLRGRRWEDEIEQPQTTGGYQKEV